MPYSHSAVALALLALGSLAGCLSGPVDELDPEDVGSTDQAVINATATIFNTGGYSVNVRSTPSTSGAVVGSVAEGASVGIECQTTGTMVEGTSIWDFLPGYGGYVTDAYVYTGYDGFIPGMPKCEPVQPPSPGGSLGATIVALGRQHKGYEAGSDDCNKFSAALGTGCVAWCSDFVRYIWGQADADTTGLNAYSGSFQDYGYAHGTWKGKATTPKVGDAVVWGSGGSHEHVAIISEVSGATFKILHGNYDYDGDGGGEVFETGFVDNTDMAGTPSPILGYASPVP